MKEKLTFAAAFVGILGLLIIGVAEIERHFPGAFGDVRGDDR